MYLLHVQSDGDILVLHSLLQGRADPGVLRSVNRLPDAVPLGVADGQIASVLLLSLLVHRSPAVDFRSLHAASRVRDHLRVLRQVEYARKQTGSLIFQVPPHWNSYDTGETISPSVYGERVRKFLRRKWNKKNNNMKWFTAPIQTSLDCNFLHSLKPSLSQSASRLPRLSPFFLMAGPESEAWGGGIHLAGIAHYTHDPNIPAKANNAGVDFTIFGVRSGRPHLSPMRKAVTQHSKLDKR